MTTHRLSLFITSLLLLSACAATPLRVVVVFKETQDLTIGSAVKVGKIHVGQVVGLKAVENEQIAVEIQVDSTYRDRVTEDSDFSIERVSLLGGGHYVAIEPGEGPAAKSGAQLRGSEALWTHFKGWAKDIHTWLRNPELRDKVKNFASMVSNAAKQGHESFENAKPKLKKQAAELIDLARKEGPEAAKRVKDLIDGLLDN